MNLELKLEQLFPSQYNRGPALLVWIALIALFTSVFIKLWTPTSVNRWVEAMFVVPFVFTLITNWTTLKYHSMIQLLIIASIAPVLFFIINYLRSPEEALKYADFERLARIYLFVPAAWWLGAHSRTIVLLLVSGVMGLILACSLDPNFFYSIQSLLRGGRVDFGVLNAQHLSLFFSIASIGFICGAHYSYKKNSEFKLVFLALSVCGLLISLLIIYGSQTRASAVALSFTFLTFFVINARSIFSLKNKGRSIYFTFSLVLILTVLTYVISKPIVHRFSTEKETIASIIKGDLKDIPYSSVGLRVHTWVQAGNWIIERPLIGHGGKVRKHVIKSSSSHPEWVKSSVGHFHNSFIEFALGFGLVGLAIAIAPLLWLLQRSAKFRNSLEAFTFCSIIVFLCMNIFESYLFFWVGPFLLLLVLSPLTSISFAVKGNNNPQR